jgi:uncharacterized protein (TIGR03435 family)
MRNYMRRFLTSVALALILIIATVPRLRAQASETGSRSAFEVASVKPSKSDGAREFQIHPGGRLTIYGMSVKDLVRRAYLFSDAPQDENRVIGGPLWARSDLFDVVAKADGDLGWDALGRPMRLLAMLQATLEERFRVRVHTESRQTSVYELRLSRKDGRLGKGLRTSMFECPVFAQGIPRPVPDPVRWCGLRANEAGGVVHIVAQGMTMADLALQFSGMRSVGRPVHDKTGLAGTFDFRFEFMPVFAPGTVPADSASGAAASPSSGASLFTAIREQLGLTLLSVKAPVEFVIIDEAEHPAQD